MLRHLPLLTAAFAVIVPLVGAQDSVRLRTGAVEQGRIDSEDYDALRIKVKKGKEESAARLAWSDVVEVKYGAATELQQALGQLNAGNRAAALPKLQSLLAGSTLRKELRPAAMFQLGSGQARSGQADAATATLLELVKTFPKSRYLVPATQVLVDLHLAAGKLDAAVGAIEAATAAAREGGVPANHLVAFDYFRGLVHEAKKELVDARTSYQSASRVDSVLGGIAGLAKVGMARADAASGQGDAARAAFRELVEQAQGNEVLAGAWNGLARLGLQDGIKGKSAEKLTDALFMFLRSVVEFAPSPGEGTGEYERALAGAAEVFHQLAELETDDATKKQHAQRCKQRLDQLRKEFPDSLHLPK